MARVAWAALLLIGSIVAHAAFAQEAAPLKPAFELLDASAATLSPQDTGLYKFDLPVRNSGTKQGGATVKVLSDTEGKCGSAEVKSEPDAAISLEPGAVTILHLVVSGVTPPAICYLEFVPETGNTLSKQIKLAQRHVTSTMYCLLWTCAVVALLNVLLAWFLTNLWSEGAPACFKLGLPAWELDKSWTSTTTLLSATLSAGMTLTALPDLTRFASKPGYATLSFLVSLAIVLAPFAFTACRIGSIVTDKAGKHSVLFQGCLLWLAVSCTITLFAGLTQIVLLILLLGEIFPGVEWALAFPGAAVAAALCWYVGHSFFLTVTLQKKADTETDASKDATFTTTVGAKRIRPLPWPVL